MKRNDWLPGGDETYSGVGPALRRVDAYLSEQLDVNVDAGLADIRERARASGLCAAVGRHDDGWVSARRVVLVVPCLAVAGSAVLLAVTQRDQAAWAAATVVSAVVGVAALGVAVWAALPGSATGVRVTNTGSATAGSGGRAVTGYVGPAGRPAGPVEVSGTGDAEALARPLIDFEGKAAGAGALRASTSDEVVARARRRREAASERACLPDLLRVGPRMLKVLAALKRPQRERHPSAIASNAGSTLANVRPLLNELERIGWVTVARVPSAFEGHRPRRVYTLTAGGGDKAGALLEAHAAELTHGERAQGRPVRMRQPGLEPAPATSPLKPGEA